MDGGCFGRMPPPKRILQLLTDRKGCTFILDSSWQAPVYIARSVAFISRVALFNNIDRKTTKFSIVWKKSARPMEISFWVFKFDVNRRLHYRNIDTKIEFGEFPCIFHEIT
jgi:hypothetical protein